MKLWMEKNVFRYWEGERPWRIKLFSAGRRNQVSSRASFRCPVQHRERSHMRVQPHLPESGCEVGLQTDPGDVYATSCFSSYNCSFPICKSKDQGEHSPGVLNWEEEAPNYWAWGGREVTQAKRKEQHSWQMHMQRKGITHMTQLWSRLTLFPFLSVSSYFPWNSPRDMQCGVMSLASWEQRGLASTDLVDCGSRALISWIEKVPLSALIVCYTLQINVPPLRLRFSYYVSPRILFSNFCQWHLLQIKHVRSFSWAKPALGTTCNSGGNSESRSVNNPSQWLALSSQTEFPTVRVGAPSVF